MSWQKVQVLRAACCVAGLDGQVCPREQRLLQRLADDAGVGPASLDAMIERAQTDPNYYEDQLRILTADSEQTVAMVLEIAAADGNVSQEERVIVGLFAQRLGLAEDRFEALLTEAQQFAARKSPKPWL